MVSTRVSATAATAGITVSAALVHMAPGVTWWPGLRRRFLPGLAGAGSATTVALTFDDGPDPASTPRLLEVLADLGVHATFFLLGEMVQACPSLVGDLTSAGHEIALHGWHHRNSLRVPPRALHDSLHRAKSLLEDESGRDIRWYRPPYGVVAAGNLWSARSLDLTTVLWGAWGEDWSETATPASVVASVRRDLQAGSTVLLHDSDCTSSPGAWRSMLGSIRPLVEEIRLNGWTTATISEHLTP